MAGLGESCSHVAAILFWMETALRIRSDVSCTSIPNTWLPMSMPHVNPSVPYTCKANLNMSSKGTYLSVIKMPTEVFKINL